MPPVGFEPIISPGERPQTYALDRAATGTSSWFRYNTKKACFDKRDEIVHAGVQRGSFFLKKETNRSHIEILGKENYTCNFNVFEQNPSVSFICVTPG